MNITYKGKTQAAHAWATELGFGRGTITGRLARGWDIERALSTPSDKSFSSIEGQKSFTKNDAELLLNDLPLDQWPKKLAELMKGTKAKKLGMHVRSHYREAFDEWYNKTYRQA